MVFVQAVTCLEAPKLMEHAMDFRVLSLRSQSVENRRCQPDQIATPTLKHSMPPKKLDHVIVRERLVRSMWNTKLKNLDVSPGAIATARAQAM